MPNDSGKDSYNPDNNTDQDYEPMMFDEIEDDDLFWKSNKNHPNPPYRKMNATQGYNTRNGIVENFIARQSIFQRI